MLRASVLALGALLSFEAHALEETEMGLCGSLQEVLGTVIGKWQETPQIGMQNPHGVATVVFANPLTGSWSLIRVFPNGMACQIDGGKEYRRYVQPDV